jgi:hypothetical protein
VNPECEKLALIGSFSFSFVAVHQAFDARPIVRQHPTFYVIPSTVNFSTVFFSLR